VPPVLVSGDHAAVARWRRESALRRTAQNRPDLISLLALAPESLGDHDLEVLAEAGFLVNRGDVAH
jgi:tRNA (guanine37-N1)-methyltransferase